MNAISVKTIAKVRMKYSLLKLNAPTWIRESQIPIVPMTIPLNISQKLENMVCAFDISLSYCSINICKGVVSFFINVNSYISPRTDTNTKI